jgi:hypothetical protein
VDLVTRGALKPQLRSRILAEAVDWGTSQHDLLPLMPLLRALLESKDLT